MEAKSDVNKTPEAQKRIVAWIQENAIPIRHVAAGGGSTDLQPLKRMLKDVKVVGLGESTHGTREMFQLKHRLLEFLVTEMGFDTFAIEASFAACQPINDYVLNGIGDRAEVLTGQWYVPWDTEEMSHMLDWMRAYNEGVSDDKKVKFFGVDITRNDTGRTVVLDYLRAVAPDRVAATQTLFDALAAEEVKWPLQIDGPAEEILLQLYPQLQELSAYLMVNKERYVALTSHREFDAALQFTRIMEQFIMYNVAALRSQAGDQNSVRSRFMAENLIWLVDRAKPEARFVLWEHNGHVGVAETSIEDPNLGYCLRNEYGPAYFSLGFEFNQGSFLTRTMRPDRVLGDLKEVMIPSSPVGSFPWYLSHADMGIFMLNLRAPFDDPVVDQWLESPQQVHHVSWAYDDTPQDFLELRSVKRYDGIIFVENTTATRPTVNALKTVRNRDGM